MERSSMMYFPCSIAFQSGYISAIGSWLRNLSVQQEFAIAFGTKDWRLNPFGTRASKCFERRFYPGHRCSLGRFVTHDSAFTDQFPARFELRFYQHHNLAMQIASQARER